jgi:CRP/FNR family cyclic AMP-dependent transcriptional regulator
MEADGVRRAAATAITPCQVLKIDRVAMTRVMHEQPAFSDLFLQFLLARSVRTQGDLIEQLFDCNEKRLSRILMLMAQIGKSREAPNLPATQETLADALGGRRSRITCFLNRFRKLGWIDFNGRIQLHRSLLKVMLRDNLPQPNGQKPSLAAGPGRKGTAGKPRQRARIRPRKANGSLSTPPPAESSSIDRC